MAVCDTLLVILSKAVRQYGTTAKLSVIRNELEEFCRTHEFSAIVPMVSQHGTIVEHLEVLSRKTPFTFNLKAAYDLYIRVQTEYGARSKETLINGHVDWKSVHHAVRVAYQAKEFLTTHSLTFPRPEAEFLLKIKMGQISYDDVSELLGILTQEVEDAAFHSTLPEVVDQDFVDDFVYKIYREHIG